MQAVDERLRATGQLDRWEVPKITQGLLSFGIHERSGFNGDETFSSVDDSC